MNTINVSQARQNFASLIDKVFAGQEYIVMKNNIKVAKIVPFEKKGKKKKISWAAFGIWKDRWPESKSSVDIVNEWRRKEERRSYDR
ncbi:MAG: hypothetical protein UV61_C0001G0103 [Candidatus Gottesmanbacteria bacterium GW2011_GWB1_43_11]|uniref:Antitoxin n=1 Tax=Candidatus Gottesmanbacteria bacterium GW2011_GWB1_43_11 TaxID=1618446 RepID=A0A0G1EXM2_9BACT|nr:MAG: hypothetical protein UV04_C0004G0045 [Candidatus Gottesmanbacteria bacterium GW2011_GWA2_42_16]KKS56068.1 MAG: hypothetical protein UV17_C0003G0040 [Candidatus Gottesmanbacteria bacterium GW2011_GWA1_42_26]KKS81621.1 MAG: hypothetical protein UV55_C0011G0015 [Candidatus Gottesmanbacteria bacterium GW2011_GWC1_43_10]KKS87696.1 MAG: hypothetical protein UV61_C0001G0103 [Candidatus Gottesmanbacteria bacterium GW2011_GWB1_43_11]OGG07510.1 MAG: hypothetical protein A2699_00490 [Candidatus Go